MGLCAEENLYSVLETVEILWVDLPLLAALLVHSKTEEPAFCDAVEGLWVETSLR